VSRLEAQLQRSASQPSRLVLSELDSAIAEAQELKAALAASQGSCEHLQTAWEASEEKLRGAEADVSRLLEARQHTAAEVRLGARGRGTALMEANMVLVVLARLGT
jgi:hypothetical protein